MVIKRLEAVCTEYFRLCALGIHSAVKHMLLGLEALYRIILVIVLVTFIVVALIIGFPFWLIGKYNERTAATKVKGTNSQGN